MSKYLIGVDLGTTSTKSVLFNTQNQVVTKSTVEYPLESSSPGAAVQNPQTIFQAAIATVKEVIQSSQVEQSEIIGLSFSAAMHSLILVDDKGKPLTPSFTWADNRSASWADKLKQSDEGQIVYRDTGTPIHSMSPLVKLIWLREEFPELWQKAYKFISLKEYIFYQLFQQYVVDYSMASATGLWNNCTLNWDDRALAIAGIKASQLSQLVPTTEIFTPMQPQYASHMGIAATTPVVIGANDGVLSNLGLGVITADRLAITLGTSGAVRTTVNRPSKDLDGLFCYALTPDYWVVGGAVNNGGIVLRWLKDKLANGEIERVKSSDRDPYQILTEIAQTIEPGAAGLIFHPYLTGERSPIWDARAKASFFGLSIHHTQAHLIRAALEGVIYNLYTVLEKVENLTGKVTTIDAAGGFARSPLWCQILADVSDRQIGIPASYESSCLGAVILAQYALGEIDDLGQIKLNNSRDRLYQPITANTDKYREILPIYNRLVDCFRSEYRAISNLK